MNTKITVIEIKHYQLKNILIKLYLNLKDIINNLKTIGTWKIQLTIANNFVSSIDNGEERVIHSKSDNIEIMINDESDEVMEELFKSLKNKYQNNFESMKGSDFVFDYVHSLYQKCHKINANPAGSNIDSPYWIKNEKAAICPINKKDNKCFQYDATVTLNHEEIEKNPKRITKIKPFINKYKWEEINSPSEKDDWKKFDKNNAFIARNVSNVKKEKNYPPYVSKHNTNRENQVNNLMILHGEGCHYLAVEKNICIIKRSNI